MIPGPAADMSAPESGSTCMFADPLQIEISAWMVGAGWIPARDVLIDGVMWTALVADSCGRGLQILARWPVLYMWHRQHTICVLRGATP